MAKMNLKNYEKSTNVRRLRPDDFESIVALQRRCFPGMEPWTKEQVDSQLEVFPEGQFCVEYQGLLVASASSLILDFSLYKEWHSWEEISDNGYIRNHNPQGDTLYGIEIMVDLEVRGLKLARRLYKARKQLAKERNLRRVVIGGRIPGYSKYADQMSARDYVDKVIKKSITDAVLTKQLANGFALKRLVPNYLDDEASRGYGTFLEWANLDYVPAPNRFMVTVAPVRVCVVQYQMREVKSFDEFASQCEYFVDVASDYRCDFILFPEMLTTQLLSFIRGGQPSEAVRELTKFTPEYLNLFTSLAVKYNVNIIGGSHFPRCTAQQPKKLLWRAPRKLFSSGLIPPTNSAIRSHTPHHQWLQPASR